MAVKLFSKQSPETKPSQFYEVNLLNRFLQMIASFNCLITGVPVQPIVRLHCLITTLYQNTGKFSS